MASAFDISTLTWQQPGVLLTPEGAAVVPVIIDEDARALDSDPTAAGRDRYILKAGTPIALISGGTTYKPVRRDTVTSATYSTATTKTTVTLDTSANPFAVGDTCQAYTTVDEAGADLGAIETINYSTRVLTFDGDQTGDVAADDYMDVTETSIRDANAEPGALILITTCELFNADQAAPVDTPFSGLVRGLISGAALLGPLGTDDAQLLADIAGHMTVYTAP